MVGCATHWQRGAVTNFFFLPRATHRGLIIADMRWRPTPLPPPELCLTLKMVDIAQPPKVQRRRRRLASSFHILPRRSHPPMFVADSSSSPPSLSIENSQQKPSPASIFIDSRRPLPFISFGYYCLLFFSLLAIVTFRPFCLYSSARKNKSQFGLNRVSVHSFIIF
jgi:hypothetical protein